MILKAGVWILIGSLALLGGCKRTAIMPSGNVDSDTKLVSEVVPTIQKGVTTKADLIAQLGEPNQSSVDVNGVEMLMFAEKTPFWEDGGVGALLNNRRKLSVIHAFIENGVVVNFQTSETWVKGH